MTYTYTHTYSVGCCCCRCSRCCMYTYLFILYIHISILHFVLFDMIQFDLKKSFSNTIDRIHMFVVKGREWNKNKNQQHRTASHTLALHISHRMREDSLRLLCMRCVCANAQPISLSLYKFFMICRKWIINEEHVAARFFLLLLVLRFTCVYSAYSNL